MKKTLLILLISLAAQTLWAQENNLLVTLNSQVEAFNNRDIETLASNVSKDFKWFYITSDSLILEVDGKSSFQSSMEDYFNAFSFVKTRISNYVIHDSRISFKEQIKYVDSKGDTLTASSIGVYEIKEGLIRRAWYFLD